MRYSVIGLVCFCLGAAVFDLAASPRLVGYGCEGSGGILYADEEDHFPRCQRIEAYHEHP